MVSIGDKEGRANARDAGAALKEIADWPDGGNRYGQENIKRFARRVLADLDVRPGGGGEKYVVQTTIFLVMASTMYEGSDPLRAFPSRATAEAFAQACRDYDATYRSCPTPDATQSEWDNWLLSDREWAMMHPAAPYIRRMTYDVCELDFGEAGDMSSISAGVFPPPSRGRCDSQ
ncbi:hypothetical protein [Paraburkholderia tropica]|uniref:hypothetical protein n=1 Tax=Paraburkholderia tropica TaxID=92647 RepID=UPI002AB70668|nr:hypothetical protein [Paraburkholderia tropica]